jgi:hypothetical protein
VTDDPGRYARAEWERRFRLAAAPSGLGDPVHIVDRYLEGTRLRLRRTTAPDGTVVRKLGQKVRAVADDPSVVWLTTLYLDEAEFTTVAALPASVLEKDRFAWPEGGCSVDVFAGALQGLVLAEVECEDEAGFRAVAAPPGAVAEVTLDDRFSGGQLAGTSAAALAGLLRGRS